ncbi:outer membrane beta-barrel protein [Vibrio breoganii]
MKKTVLLLALLPTYSFAQENIEGAYAGIELGVLNSVELELQGTSADADIENFPVNINAGYDIALAPNVTIGFEAEYRWLGEGKYKEGGQTLLKVSGQGLSFNLRPKFHIKNSPIYVGLLAGIGPGQDREHILNT